MSKSKYETQFSVYKVDYEQSIIFFNEELDIKINSYEELEEKIINYIKDIVGQKSKNEIKIVKNDSFKD